MRFDRPLTKRQLGVLLLLAGLFIALGSLLFEFSGLARFSGIGPGQRLAIMGGLALAILGASLIPLGNRLA